MIGGYFWKPGWDHSLDAMVVKTDSLGDEQWTKYFGNPNIDDDMAFVAMADDGNYLVATVYGEEIITPEERRGRVCIIKIDSMGNTISINKFGENRIGNHIKNFKRKNKSYISSGFYYLYDELYFKGWIINFSYEIDSLWMREYTYFNEADDWNFLYDVTPTSDNGYVAAGRANEGFTSANMWVLKVDSMGCDTPGCATGTFVKELSSFDGGKWEELRVWPNPAREMFQVQCSMLASSMFNVGKFKVSSWGELPIFDNLQFAGDESKRDRVAGGKRGYNRRCNRLAKRDILPANDIRREEFGEWKGGGIAPLNLCTGRLMDLEGQKGLHIIELQNNKLKIMKKIALLAFILSCYFSTLGQEYFPLVDSQKSWSEMNCSTGPSIYGPHSCETSIIKFMGDTTINNLNYLKVFKSDTLQTDWELQGFIRETPDKKVFFYNNYWGVEGLIYDFNIQVNDTVEIINTYGNNIDFQVVCTNIDSVIIENSYHKRFHIKNTESGDTDIWIEGVGSEFGVLKSAFFIFGATNDLLCQYFDNDLVYVSPYNDCVIMGELGPSFITTQVDTAYLNTYFEFQLQIDQVPSIDVFFTKYDNLPDGLNFDTLTGLIYGTPTELFNSTIIFLVSNYKHFTDYLATKIVVDEINTIKQRKKTTDFTVYPNPAKSYFIVRYELDNSYADALINITDISGKIVKEYKTSMTMDYLVIQTGNLKKGNYFVKLILNGKEVGVEKIIIQ